MFYACEYCHFLFSRATAQEQCPDCGKYTVRMATEAEREELSSRLSENDKLYVNGSDSD